MRAPRGVTTGRRRAPPSPPGTTSRAQGPRTQDLRPKVAGVGCRRSPRRGAVRPSRPGQRRPTLRATPQEDAMTTPHLTASLHHVIEAATLAPSVHNTQPWRFVLRPDGFDLLADPGRRLPVLDPTGRLLHLSCGAALVTARTAARALGLAADVELLPDPEWPDLLARLTVSPGAVPDDAE